MLNPIWTTEPEVILRDAVKRLAVNDFCILWKDDGIDPSQETISILANGAPTAVLSEALEIAKGMDAGAVGTILGQHIAWLKQKKLTDHYETLQRVPQEALRQATVEALTRASQEARGVLDCCRSGP